MEVKNESKEGNYSTFVNIILYLSRSYRWKEIYETLKIDIGEIITTSELMVIVLRFNINSVLIYNPLSNLSSCLNSLKMSAHILNSRCCSLHKRNRQQQLHLRLL